jgi:hypothetical protein
VYLSPLGHAVRSLVLLVCHEPIPGAAPRAASSQDLYGRGARLYAAFMDLGGRCAGTEKAIDLLPLRMKALTLPIHQRTVWGPA